MTILLAVLTISCVSWIVTKEAIFDELRTWSEAHPWLYPMRCPYCLCPWVTVLVAVSLRLPLIWFFPVVWLSYHSLSVYAWLRRAL